MTWTPHATVATIVEQNGKYLLVKEHSNGNLVINQPAGHLEPNETLAEAAKRETFEETGWEVSIKSILGFYTYTSNNNKITYHRTCFIAEAIRQTSNRPPDNNIDSITWMNYQQLLEIREQMRSPLVLRAIEDYQTGKHYPLDMIYEHK